MREFNLEDAKAGKPVCTRDGRPARIICWDRKNDIFPIMALIEYDDKELPYSYTINGKYRKEKDLDDSFDLMMVTEKKEGWVNIYRECGETYCSTGIYETPTEATAHAINSKDRIAVIKIEWEE